MLKLPVYMDCHATTPLDPRVLNVMLPYFTTKFGNSSSTDHQFGGEARDGVEHAREQVAKTISATPEEIVFTSGATESDNLAIMGTAMECVSKGRHIITCTTEHEAVLDTCKHLRHLGWSVTQIPVDKSGLVKPDKVEAAITDQTVLITIMLANNEIGTIAPISEIGAIAREHGVLLHTDAAQAVGHVPVDVDAMNVDMMSISAHKLYGPKGVGALYVRRHNPRVRLQPLIYGGGQERSLRSGTSNVPAIVGMGEAAEIAEREMIGEAEYLRGWTESLRRTFENEIVGAELNGHAIQRLPHNLNMYFPEIESKALIQSLDREVAISSGSACTTEDVEPSHVIIALGYDAQRAHSSIRFGLGRFNSQEEVDFVADRVVQAAMRLIKIRA